MRLHGLTLEKGWNQTFNGYGLLIFLDIAVNRKYIYLFEESKKNMKAHLENN